MRLEELHLDGFGHFHQRTFALADGPVTVFYGPNEAGKTTLLAFIRTILFGFPRQGRNAHYPPLAGGSHGGRIRLSGTAEKSTSWSGTRLPTAAGLPCGPVAGNPWTRTPSCPASPGRPRPTCSTAFSPSASTSCRRSER